MKSTLWTERNEAVRVLHEAGQSVMQISGELGLAVTTVYQSLAYLGLTPNRAKRADPVLDGLAEDYLAGMPILSLCAKYDISMTKLYTFVARAGLPSRTEMRAARSVKTVVVGDGGETKRVQQAQRDEGIIEAYRRGDRLARIAADFKITPPQIYQILYRNGIDTRMQARAKDARWVIEGAGGTATEPEEEGNGG